MSDETARDSTVTVDSHWNRVEMTIPEQVRLRIAADVGFNSAAAERVPECDNLERKIRTIARQSAPRALLGPAPAP
jgi:hypothetical protein